MICSHCGKVLDNEKLSFCMYCGYPLKGSRVGFFAKSETTGTSRAEELTRTEMSQQAAPAPAPVPEHAPVSQPMAAAQPTPQMPGVQPTMPGVQPAMQSVQPTMPQVAAVMPAAQPAMPQMTAQPVMPSIPGAVPQMGTVQPMMQPIPGAVPQMNPAQPLLSGMPAPIPQQPMQGAELGVPQMAYGMPQMAYGMPQMGYTMPQFAGYDAAGNPIYMQMVPQLMGYDAYGNPVYNMVAMPYVIPAMQGMPGVVPVQPQPAAAAYQPEHVIDVPQDQIRPADPTVIPAMQAAPVQPAAMQSVPVQPAPVQSVPVQSVVQTTPAQQTPVQTEVPVQQPPVERRVEIASAADIPMDAEVLMNEDEGNAMPQELPDEEAILDSIFSDAPKSYSMSSGTAPAAATFSINVSASDIISVRDEEASAPETARPKKQPASKAEKTEKKPAAAKSEKSGKSASKKKQAAKKPPATIVSPDEFFNDKQNARRDTLNVNELDQLDDEQLAARLATMQSTTGGKKSTRSMKAASREEMDVSNMNEEDLLGGSNSAMRH